MGDWNADENPYEILGLSVEATKDEQKKASFIQIVMLPGNSWQ